ncbi:hypothetical protein BIFDEN_01051 [Bifidobacterium dentium ATCC 27678]|nr:hypothetical protein BIFDEN_01051 [Bifidobacterium dentium ATCC 27678]
MLATSASHQSGMKRLNAVQTSYRQAHSPEHRKFSVYRPSDGR